MLSFSINQKLNNLWEEANGGSTWVQRSENQGLQSIPHKKIDGLDQAESELALPLPFCSVQGLNKLDDATTLGRAICFTKFINSSDDLFQKHPYRHTQKCFASYLEVP